LGLLVSHRLKDEGAKRLRDSGAPITVVAAVNDHLVRPSAQQELARLLDAEVVPVYGGHVMGYPKDREALLQAIVSQIEKSRKAGTGP
jgi:predicted alpha/beta hydrolase family esterase